LFSILETKLSTNKETKQVLLNFELNFNMLSCGVHVGHAGLNLAIDIFQSPSSTLV